MDCSAADRARRDYTRLAPGYDLIWRRYLARSIAATIDGLALADRRVLDVGCGTGLLLDRLRRDAPGVDLVGLDATPAMLDRARARLGDAATLLRGDADRLPFADAQFDLVVSTSVLHELASPRAAVREWARVLSPGGTLAVTDWRADHPGTQAYLRLLRLLGRNFRPLTVHELERVVLDAGLRLVRTRTLRAHGWGLMTVHAVLTAG